MIFGAILCGLAIGLVLGAVGGGGGLLVLPVFIYVVGEPVGSASASSLAVVALAAALGAARADANGAVCWRLAITLAPAVLLGSALGALASLRVPGELVILAFVPLLVAAAVATWSRAGGLEQRFDPGCPPTPPLAIAAVGLAVGVLTGFFGVGGGFVIVPALTLVVGLGMRRAAGTSLVVICAAAVTGLLAHLAGGRSVELGITVAVALAAAAGALAGASWGGRLPQRQLGRGFAAITLITAAGLLLDVLLAGGPPS